MLNVTVITKYVGTSHLQQSDVLKSENIHGTRIRKTLEDYFRELYTYNIYIVITGTSYFKQPYIFYNFYPIKQAF